MSQWKQNIKKPLSKAVIFMVLLGVIKFSIDWFQGDWQTALIGYLLLLGVLGALAHYLWTNKT